MHTIRHAGRMDTDYPLQNTPAARMLSDGLARARDEQGLSIRQIGKQMNYKTSVVLSHMALGRVPIPIDRAMEMAEILHLDQRVFLLAVLRQRHPDIPWESLTQAAIPCGSDGFALELQTVIGGPLEDLNREQRAVIREVVAERSPRKRWLTVHELRAVELLREMFPHMQSDGIDQEDLERLRATTSTR